MKTVTAVGSQSGPGHRAAHVCGWLRRIVPAALVPLAFALGAGSQMLQPLAIGVIGGVLISVVLSNRRSGGRGLFRGFPFRIPGRSSPCKPGIVRDACELLCCRYMLQP